MSTASYHTITCNIKGITQEASVDWTTGTNTAVISDGSEYVGDEGTITKNNKQQATLKITGTELGKLGATTPFTCKVSSGISSKWAYVTLTVLKFG